MVYSRILSFFSHINRREESIERLTVQGKLNGRRRRGRSLKQWVDVTKELMGKNFGEAVRLANNRDRWHEAVKRAIHRRDTN